MPGPVPGIHVLRTAKQDVDGRDKPGHDEWKDEASTYPIIKESKSWLPKTLNFPETRAIACCAVSMFSPTR
jgi:hypothetical protein